MTTKRQNLRTLQFYVAEGILNLIVSPIHVNFQTDEWQVAHKIHHLRMLKERNANTRRTCSDENLCVPCRLAIPYKNNIVPKYCAPTVATIQLVKTFESRHEKYVYGICEQQRRRSTCASAQSDQLIYCSLLR